MGDAPKAVIDTDLLAQLGLTREEVIERVIARIANDFTHTLDSDGESFEHNEVGRRLRDYVQKRIDCKVIELGDRYVLPRVSELVENASLQKTNEWGEKKGAPLTFVEYLVQRAEAYVTEQVDGDGKSRSESNGYGWSGRTTRIAHMVHKHLHHSIETAMKEALAKANSVVAGGIESAVKLGLKTVLADLKVSVKT